MRVVVEGGEGGGARALFRNSAWHANQGEICAYSVIRNTVNSVLS